MSDFLKLLDMNVRTGGIFYLHHQGESISWMWKQ
jgi:hypothetical protein